MPTRIDRETLLDSINLLDVIEADLGPAPKRSGPFHYWCCPFHNDRTPSFAVKEGTRSWRCYGACRKSGNAIDYVMRQKDLEFKPACDYLAKFAGGLPKIDVASSVQTQQQDRVYQPQAAAEMDTWQRRAREFAQECHFRLFDDSDPNGAATLRWLNQRGLTRDTIKSAQLGCSVEQLDSRSLWGLPNDGYRDKVALLPGVLVPWYECGAIKRLTIRRYPFEVLPGMSAKPHKILPGSANFLYGLEQVDTTLPVVLVEAVFDALSVKQEAGDLVQVVAAGGIDGAQTAQSVEKLSAAPLVLLSFDNDAAGDQGAKSWSDLLSNAKRWRPVIVKDPNEMLQKGIPIRRWIEAGIDH